MSPHRVQNIVNSSMATALGTPSTPTAALIAQETAEAMVGGSASADDADAFITAIGAGLKNGSAVAQTEQIGAGLFKTTLTLTDLEVTLTLNGTSTGGGGVKIYDFPAGYIKVLGVTSNLTVANAGGDGSFLASLGSAVADTGGTLATTEANVCASTAATVSSGVGTCKMKGDTVSALDGTSTAIDLYLNAALNADGTDKEVLEFSGTITIHWLNLGDN